jgi:BlaI family transcriptional regulator, penicillinase repressor
MTLNTLKLSRRERQIMDVLFQKERATVTEVMESLPEAPGYSAVRSLLRILEEKGHIRHETDGARFVFMPNISREKAKRSAVRHLLQTFFDGAPERAVAALLDESSAKLTAADFDRLEEVLRKARKGAKP